MGGHEESSLQQKQPCSSPVKWQLRQSVERLAFSVLRTLKYGFFARHWLFRLFLTLASKILQAYKLRMNVDFRHGSLFGRPA